MRALGTRHSFNDLADNGATLVTVTGIAPEPVLDEAARTVTVGAGISYGPRGVAPAAGLGAAQPGIAAAHLGGRRDRHRNPRVRQPQPDPVGRDRGPRVRGRRRRAPPRRAARTRASTGWRSGSARSASSSASPSTCSRPTWSGRTCRRADLGPGAGRAGRGHVRRLQRQPVHRLDRGLDPGGVGEAQARRGQRRRDAGGVLRRAPATSDRPGWSTPRSTTSPVVGAAGPWSERLPHLRIDSPPSNGDEIQSEYFVDRGNGAAALDAVRQLSP